MTRKTKTELIAAVSMLLVAAVMLSSASFAWMTISQAPEVENLKVEMGVTANLEIAKANTSAWGETPEVSGNDIADTSVEREMHWGSKVTAFSAASSINWPVKTSDGATYTVKFDDDGRTAGVTQELTVNPSTMNAGVISYTANVNTASSTAVNTTINRTVKAGYGVWLRSNQDLTTVKAVIDTSSIAFYRGGVVDDAHKTTSLSAADLDVSVTLYDYSNKKVNGTTLGAIASDDVSTLALTSTAATTSTFSLVKNEPKLVVITLGVNGPNLIASDFTSGAGLIVQGIKVDFSSDEVSNGNYVNH